MGDTPTPRFPGGTERSVTHGEDRQGRREAEAEPGAAEGNAAGGWGAPPRPPVRGPAQSGAALPGGRVPPQAGRPRTRRRLQYARGVGAPVSRRGGSGPAGEADTAAPAAPESGPGGEGGGRRPQAAPPRGGDPEDQPVPAARAVPAGEPGDGAPHPARAPAPQEATPQTPAEPGPTALLRARHAEPALADRHLHLPPGRQERLPDRLPRRPLPLRGGAGRLPQPDGGARPGSVPPGGGGVRGPQGAALRPGPAVLQLARDHPVRGGAPEGSGAPHQEPPAPPHDPGQAGALLEDDLGGVPGARPVRELRGGRRADPALGDARQPPAAPPGPGGALPGGSLLRHRPGAPAGDRAGHPGERARARAPRAAPEPLLHGGPAGRAVGGDPGGEGPREDARRWRGIATTAGGDLRPGRRGP